MLSLIVAMSLGSDPQPKFSVENKMIPASKFSIENKMLPTPQVRENAPGKYVLRQRWDGVQWHQWYELEGGKPLANPFANRSATVNTTPTILVPSAACNSFG